MDKPEKKQKNTDSNTRTAKKRRVDDESSMEIDNKIKHTDDKDEEILLHGGLNGASFLRKKLKDSKPA